MLYNILILLKIPPNDLSPLHSFNQAVSTSSMSYEQDFSAFKGKSDNWCSSVLKWSSLVMRIYLCFGLK